MPPPGTRKPSGKPLRRELAVKHWQDLLASGLTLSRYARRGKLFRGELVASFIKHVPQEWEEHKGKLGPILEGSCARCGRQFYLNWGNQRFCGGTCRDQAWRSKPEVIEYQRAKTARWRQDHPDRPDRKRRQISSGDETQNSEG